MIRSMTGFGEAASHIDGVHYHLELRSLNNRYFKATVRLPEDLQGLEAEIEAALRVRVARGAVTAICKCTDTSATAAHVINRQALAHYIRELRETPGIESDDIKIDAAAMLALPGVLQPPEDEERLHRARDAFLSLLETAADRLIEMRTREGQRLVADLDVHRKLIEEKLATVRARAPQVVGEFETRLRQRIESLLQDAGVQADPADLLREVAVHAEKSDIAEEIARLTAHTEQFADLVSGAEEKPIGRTLDFLAQEMLREANTIASKSSDAQIARDIVEVKGAIDRIKEQVQNVE